MENTNYVKQFEWLLLEIKRLRDERDAINFDFLKVIRLLEVTASMLPDADVDFVQTTDAIMMRLNRESIGLTEAVQIVLRRSPGTIFAPPQVRKELERNGFSFVGYRSNPLTSIASTLKRLHGEGTVSLLTSSGGKKGYRWKLLGSGAWLDMTKDKE